MQKFLTTFLFHILVWSGKTKKKKKMTMMRKMQEKTVVPVIWRMLSTKQTNQGLNSWKLLMIMTTRK